MKTLYSGLLIVCALSIQNSVWAELYRWVDDNGKVHYSDQVPPEQAQSGHSELNKSGLKVKEVSAAKPASQAKEEKWLKELEKKQKEKLAARQRANDQLLNSYTSLEHLDQFYNKRLDDIRKNRQQLNQAREKLLTQQQALQSQLEKAKGKKNRERVQGFLENVEANLENYQMAILQSQKDEKKAHSEFLVLRERYSLLQQQRKQALKQ